MVHAGKKSFIDSANLDFKMPTLPRGTMRFDELLQLVDPSGEPLAICDIRSSGRTALGWKVLANRTVKCTGKSYQGIHP
jgi:hypothetical protein